MPYEDDWIKAQIALLKMSGIESPQLPDILGALHQKIIKLEQDIKELKNGGKKK